MPRNGDTECMFSIRAIDVETAVAISRRQPESVTRAIERLEPGFVPAVEQDVPALIGAVVEADVF